MLYSIHTVHVCDDILVQRKFNCEKNEKSRSATLYNQKYTMIQQ
jgi:hypothetical protein